jgi:hypothetical protein
MKRRINLPFGGGILTVVICSLFLVGTAMGYDVTEKFSVGGVLAGNWQYLQGAEDADGEDVDDGPKAAVALQPEMSFRPYENSELFAKFGFAANSSMRFLSMRSRAILFPTILAEWPSGPGATSVPMV